MELIANVTWQDVAAYSILFVAYFFVVVPLFFGSVSSRYKDVLLGSLLLHLILGALIVFACAVLWAFGHVFSG